MRGRLEGRVGIVTGGSAGIGRATCLALAAEGARVVAVGRNAARLAETLAMLHESGHEGLALALDVQAEPDMELMVRRTLETFGRIDILVAAAGILRGPGATMRGVAHLPTDEWDMVMDTNLRGLFLSNRAVLPAMLGQRGGDILNVSSISGRTGMAYHSAYSASKAAIIGLTQALGDEVRSEGVRAQVLVPGPFETDLLHRLWSGAQPRTGDYPPAARVAEMIVHMVTMPPDVRLVAPVIEPLASEARGFRKGQETTGGRKTPAHAGRPAEAPAERLVLEGQTMPQNSPDRAPSLAGKVVIITGGTGGIGLATAHAAANEGASVVLADINQERIDAEVLGLPVAPGGNGHLGVRVDVREEADHQNLIRATLERFERIDALVACAGILRKRGTPPKPLVKTSTEEWDEVVGVNLRGTFLANRGVLPTMIKQRSGTIINISSVSGLEGRAHDAPYCASKFGVIGLTQSVADEVRSHGIKVQALMPDAVDTPIWEQNHPVPKPGDALAPERVADVIIFMLTQPEDAMLVGAVIAPLGARRRQFAGKPPAGRDGTAPATNG